MKTSEFDGQPVVYVDNMRLKHSGVVAGQSDDGAFILVQSDNPNVPAAAWHFSVRRELIAGMLVKPSPLTPLPQGEGR